MTDLAKRAVACKHWRWMPGMLALPPKADRCQHKGQMMVGRLPDLTDPATLGCLLGLVRESWGRPGIVCTCLPSDAFGWLCVGEYGATEAEALVAALEAAP